MLSESKREKLLDYVDGKLGPAEHERLQHALKTDPELAAEYEQYLRLENAALDWQDQHVPEWSRSRYFHPTKTRNSALWLNWTSLAFSVLALAAVVLRLEVGSNDQGLYVSFAKQSSHQANVASQDNITQNYVSQAQLNELLLQQSALTDARLNEFALQQYSFTEKLVESNARQIRQERHFELTQVTDQWEKLRSRDLQMVSELAEDQFYDRRTLKTLLTQVRQ